MGGSRSCQVKVVQNYIPFQFEALESVFSFLWDNLVTVSYIIAPWRKLNKILFSYPGVLILGKYSTYTAFTSLQRGKIKETMCPV